jgi:Methyltransferase domain
MRRVNIPEILDSPDCPPDEVAHSLRDIARVNRWFGGMNTSLALVERVAAKTGGKKFSLLEVAAGFGEVPKAVAQKLARQGIDVQVTLLDIARSHLRGGERAVVANALALPFRDGAFDLISCSLFAHHLEPVELQQFVRESMRVCRCAVLINDLVRHPLHVALGYAAYPLLRSPASRHDGVASVRRSYVPTEMQEIIAAAFPDGSAPRVEVFQHYLFRMGVIAWKNPQSQSITA